MGEHHSESPSNYNAWEHCIHWRGTSKNTAESSAGTNHHNELHRGLTIADYEPETYVARWAKDEIDSLRNGIPVGSECLVNGSRSIPELEGIFGTADVVWRDSDNRLHIADLKSFSDGTDDYSPQLKGYASLIYARGDDLDADVFLHILHGGICKTETCAIKMRDCINDTVDLLNEVRSGKSDYNINKYCQYCSRIKECPMANNAVQVVNGNGSVDFSKMSLPQKLVICEAVEKLIKTLKEDAKQQAIENGGVLEADGIKYEIKERAGKGKVRNLCELAGAMENMPDGMVGLSNENLLSLCELPKTAFVAEMKEANAENKSVKKKDIESWCASFYDKGEPIQVLSRVS